jgi:site-specific recombinase XerD
METQIITTTEDQNLELLLETTLSAVGQGSRPVYAGAIRAYVVWARTNYQPNAYASLLAYRSNLEEKGLQFGTINRIMSALRGYFRTAYTMGMVDEKIYRQIREVKNIPTQGQKRGNWLSVDQATALLALPDVDSWAGRRDRAILAVMLGCGLRRAEVANLCWKHITLHDGVWHIEDILGKHNRTRTIPMAPWVMEVMDEYWPTDHVMGRDPNSRIFMSHDRHGNLHESLTPHTIWMIVKHYATLCRVPNLRPHDLRRTYAELSRRGGAQLEEVQQLLGHASLTTTQRYLALGVDPQRAKEFIHIEV